MVQQLTNFDNPTAKHNITTTKAATAVRQLIKRLMNVILS